MPNDVEEIKDLFLSEPYPNADSLPQHIKTFCAGRLVVAKVLVADLRQAAEIAVKQALGTFFLLRNFI